MSALARLLREIGLGEEALRKLSRANIRSLESLAFMSSRRLAEALGIDEPTAEGLIKRAREMIGLELMDLLEYLERNRMRFDIFTTGSHALDNLLGGGIPTHHLVELAGPFGSGKTQLCHQLCVTVQLPQSEGGLESGAVFIDADGTFRPERIIRIAKRFKLDGRSVLRRILYARVLSFAEQYSALVRSRKFLEKGIRLVVLDSLSGLVREEFGGDLIRRQEALARLLMEARSLAEGGASVVITNQVTVNMKTGELVPVGGLILPQAVDIRILLLKEKGDRREARIVHSVVLPEGKATFRILDGGIVDVE
mgnify:CR=1 FL=1